MEAENVTPYQCINLLNQVSDTFDPALLKLSHSMRDSDPTNPLAYLVDKGDPQ